jgi:hypothetical protein
MCNDLIGNMRDIGFELTETGGNCRAMVQHVRGRTIVATSGDGPDLPYEDDFLISVYAGDWTANPDAPELVSYRSTDEELQAPASGLFPLDEALERARAVATAPYAIEPQRDAFKGTPDGADGSTCFMPCGEAEAEAFAVYDPAGREQGDAEYLGDFPTRAAAEAFIAAREG